MTSRITFEVFPFNGGVFRGMEGFMNDLYKKNIMSINITKIKLIFADLIGIKFIENTLKKLVF